MKKLHAVSLIVMAIALIVYVLLRNIGGVPDWTIRVTVIPMLVGIFTLVFSTVKLRDEKGRK